MKLGNKGVTMMLLVITIILMIMIAFLAVYYSENVAPEARVASAYASLKAIKDTCRSTVILYDSNRDEYYFFGNNIKTEHTDAELEEYAKRCGLNGKEDLQGDRVYLIDPFSDRVEDKRRIKNLELSNLSNAFIIDLDNDKYYLIDGVARIDGSNYISYEYMDIQSMYDMIRSYGETEG